MSSRRLHWMFRIACIGMIAGAATLILSDILQRPVLAWIALALVISAGIAGIVGSGFVMAKTLNDEDL